MLLIALLLAVVTVAVLELAYGILLFAVVWALPLLCAVAAMHFVVELRLDDPMASLWAFLGVALMGRFLVGRLRVWSFRVAG
jgi:hypothetical protein